MDKMTAPVRIVAVGLVVAMLGACGGNGNGNGEDDAEAGAGGSCPRGAPTVSVTRMAFNAAPNADSQYDLTLSFEVANEATAAIIVQSIDVDLFTHVKRSTWPEPPTVAASETVTLDGQVQVPGLPVDLELQPEPDEVQVEWAWADQRHDDCRTRQATIEPVTGDITETIGTPPAPDLLAIGETAVFPLPSGQEVRLTVTDVSYDGDCPESGAPPPQNGAYLFVSLRLEVTPGREPWRVHAMDWDAGPYEVFPPAQAAVACVGSSPAANNLQTVAGQTVEGVFVFDVMGPTQLTYHFGHASGTDGSATWDISPS